VQRRDSHLVSKRQAASHSLELVRVTSTTAQAPPNTAPAIARTEQTPYFSVAWGMGFWSDWSIK
jgi:hypothetical protein